MQDDEMTVTVQVGDSGPVPFDEFEANVEAMTSRRVYRVWAKEAAIAWQNSALACSKDKHRAQLFKTVSVEFFKSGLQLIATNGHALVRTWCPYSDIGDLPAPMPGWQERATEDRVVVSDADGFALAFMKALASAVGDEPQELELSIETVKRDEAPALGDELAEHELLLHALGQRLACRLYDGAFPDWCGLNLGLDPAERVDGLVLAPRVLAIAGKLKGVTGLDMEFLGDERAVRFIATGPEPRVAGVLMPMRRPEKAATSESADDEDED